MKIDRLLGIVMILLQKDKVTAPYLAGKFEVSKRTINRDIEDLCMAGIPIITTQGGNGGISIADGYKVDKSVLTYEEMQNIAAGLKVIDSISAQGGTEKLLNKFHVKQDSILSVRDSIIINLSSHYKSALTDKITLIKDAIHRNTRIIFRYYSSKGDSLREIEPYYLAFQWSAWYVFGYCLEKKDFRLFKLNRLWELADTDRVFEPREIPEERQDFESYFTDEIQITALFDESVKYRLIDEYGAESYTVTEEGRLLFRMSFTNKDFMLSWILSFGDKAEILYPKGLKQEIRKIAENILRQY
jgi:predicted DNA-binding transcriptional regulator YafY